MKTSKFLCLPLLLALSSSLSYGGLNGNPATPGDDPPYIVNSGWAEFTWFNGPGTLNQEGPFTFNSAFPTLLKVTDGYLDGDRFEVLDFGLSIGLTSVPTDDGSTANNNYDFAYGNPLWSSGAFPMAPGPHSISIRNIQIPVGYPEGAGALRVDLIPEPSALALLGLGVVALIRRGK